MIATMKLPQEDYLPARMLNEFAYCPRLFYYEHVEGLFAHNRETVEGELRHSRVDEKQDELPPPEQLAETDRPVRSRSVMLSSDACGVIAKMDLVESEVRQAFQPDTHGSDHGSQAGKPGTRGDSLAGKPDVRVIPVDYKRGRPRKGDDGSIEAWDTDIIQLAVQALVLRDNGYRCDEAVVYYVATKQRVRITIDDPLIEQTIELIGQAREVAASDHVPPPLVDSPKCPRCSLVGICLPDETNRCMADEGASVNRIQKTLFDMAEPRSAVAAVRAEKEGEIRRLVPARDDLRPLYLNTQGLYIGKSGGVLKVKEKGKVIQEVRLTEICQLNLMGNVQLTTQAIQGLCQAEIPIAYFSMGGWFYGVTQGLGVKNIFLRREQFRLADVPSFCLRLARALVAGKIRNQRTMLQRNHVEPPKEALVHMKCMQQDAEQADCAEQLLGIEGNAARVYFQNFSGMIKVGRDDGSEISSDEPEAADRDAARAQAGQAEAEKGDSVGPLPGMSFDFASRNRRPPRDPVNSLLSLAYSLLSKDLTVVAQTVGFDPYLGYFHQPRFGRASLALDLMEPFRPLISDSAVLTAINTRMVTLKDFIRAGNAVSLTPEGRKKFFQAYEQRMDTLITHPLFGYRVNYRRLLEIQTRLLARVLTGEMSTYPVFTTR